MTIAVNIEGKNNNVYKFIRLLEPMLPVDNEAYVYMLTKKGKDGEEIIEFGETDNFFKLTQEESKFETIKDYLFNLNDKYLYILPEISKVKREEILKNLLPPFPTIKTDHE
jgi:hypothetical protein